MTDDGASVYRRTLRCMHVMYDCRSVTNAPTLDMMLTARCRGVGGTMHGVADMRDATGDLAGLANAHGMSLACMSGIEVYADTYTGYAHDGVALRLRRLLDGRLLVGYSGGSVAAVPRTVTIATRFFAEDVLGPSFPERRT